MIRSFTENAMQFIDERIHAALLLDLGERLPVDPTAPLLLRTRFHATISTSRR